MSIISKAPAIVKSGLKFASEHLPEIMLFLGTTSIVAGTVVTASAATKLPEMTENFKEELDEINGTDIGTHYINDVPVEYTKSDKAHDLASCRIRNFGHVVANFGPGTAMIAGGLGLIGFGFKVEHDKLIKTTEELVKVSGAYSSLYAIFKKYRQNVIEDAGIDKDKQYRFGIRPFQAGDINPETGKPLSKKDCKDETIMDENSKSYVATALPDIDWDYARIFDEFNQNWQDDPEYNKNFVRLAERTAQNRYNSGEKVFLNDVYELLGFPRTQKGSIMGWYKGAINDDGYVDFGITNLYTLARSESARAFLNGYEASIVLDFNCVPIFEYLPEH